MSGVVVAQPIPIEVSADRLSVSLIVSKTDQGTLTAEHVFARLCERSIPVTDAVRGRVAALVEAVSAGQLSREPFVLAEGKPPVAGIGARVELAPSPEDKAELGDGQGRTDFYRSRIATVGEGEVIGTFFPETPPVAGIDVFGKPVEGERPIVSVALGENVELASDGKTLIASKAGRLNVNRHSVSVVSVVETKSDVDFSTGNIESPTDVLIGGTIRDTFVVKSAKSVAVRGAIEAAVVEAGTDIQVSGGVAGRGQGKVTAGGQITSKFCEEANLRAGGDIVIISECINSRLHALGRLMIPSGKLVGGYAYAREGAEIEVVGNEADRATEIAIGVDPIVLGRSAQADEVVKKKREAIAKIREKIQPLMAQLKRLNPQQRERATELMYEADQMEAEILETERKKQEAIAACSPNRRVCLLVKHTVYPGVKVVLGDKMTIFRNERRGPLKVERRLVNRVEEICVVDQISGSVTTMPGYEFRLQDSAAEKAHLA
ncbi:MAG TPA: FapA family protein [Phycisphaerae bacterium]|nr:FapA family protein [Phycisphaerae bacterium]HRY69421.1 FapA family protein [Phycisphaerae bacterium]HSA26288.1 FapA family protein [Phycisphaerae bacterium]